MLPLASGDGSEQKEQISTPGRSFLGPEMHVSALQASADGRGHSAASSGKIGPSANRTN